MPPSIKFSHRMPPDLATAVDAHCAAAKVPRSDGINAILAERLGVPYTSSQERIGLAGADLATIRKVVRKRIREVKKQKRKERQHG